MDQLVLGGQVRVVVQLDAVLVWVAQKTPTVVQDWAQHCDQRYYTPEIVLKWNLVTFIITASPADKNLIIVAVSAFEVTSDTN